MSTTETLSDRIVAIAEMAHQQCHHPDWSADAVHWWEKVISHLIDATYFIHCAENGVPADVEANGVGEAE